MNVFFDIPKVQQVDLLTKWLDLSSIVALDSATCSRKWRPEFLDLLSSPELVLLEEYSFSEEFSEDWVVSRKISFAEVDICYRILLDDVARNALLKVLGPKLRSLTLSCAQEGYEGWIGAGPPLQIDQILIDVTENCTNLISLTIYSAQLDGTLATLINSNQQLQNVDLSSCKNITSSVLKAIMKLPCLLDFTLHKSYVADSATVPICAPNHKCQYLMVRTCNIKPELVVWLCQSMPSLTKLHVDVQVGDELVTIARSCPHVTDACITLGDKLSDTAARAVAKEWRCIEILVILRRETSRLQPACNEAAAMIFINQCPSLLQLKLAHSLETDRTPSSLFYAHVDYDRTNAPLSVADNTRSRLTDLCVPVLNAQTLASVVQTCPYLNTLRIVHPAPVMVDPNAAEFALHHLKNTNIKTLYLKNCSNLDHTHIRSLKGLTKLVLCNTKLESLRTNHLADFCRRNPALCELFIRSCAGIDYNIVLEALDRCPKLTHFEYRAKESEGGHYPTDPASMIMETVIRRSYKNLKYFVAQF